MALASRPGQPGIRWRDHTASEASTNDAAVLNGARRAEVAGEDLGLADRLVREETVGGLGVGPVLAGQGDGRADRACHLHEELAQPPAQTFVLERRARDLLVYPGSGIPAGTIHRAPGLCVSVPDNGSRPGRSAQAQGCIPQMWVIGSGRQRLPSSCRSGMPSVAPRTPSKRTAASR